MKKAAHPEEQTADTASLAAVLPRVIRIREALAAHDLVYLDQLAEDLELDLIFELARIDEMRIACAA